MAKEPALSDFHDKWLDIADKGSEDYDSLTPAERIWFNVQSLMEDAITGGLISHYYNSGGDYNKDTIEDLMKLGCRDVAELLLRLNNLFPDSQPPADMEERNEIVFNWDEDEHDELFDEVDDIYFEKEADLENRLVEHILKEFK